MSPTHLQTLAGILDLQWFGRWVEGVPAHQLGGGTGALAGHGAGRPGWGTLLFCPWAGSLLSEQSSPGPSVPVYPVVRYAATAMC